MNRIYRILKIPKSKEISSKLTTKKKPQKPSLSTNVQSKRSSKVSQEISESENDFDEFEDGLSRLYGNSYVDVEKCDDPKQEEEEIDDDEEENFGGANGSVETEKNVAENCEKDSKFVKNLQKETSEMKEILKKVDISLDNLRSDYAKSDGCYGVKEREEKNRINAERKNNSKLLNVVKEYLTKFDNENKGLIEVYGIENTTSEYRMRVCEFNTLLKYFTEVLRKMNEFDVSCRNCSRKKVKRTLQIFSNTEIDESEVEKFLSDPTAIISEKMNLNSSIQTEYQIAVEFRKELLELETNMNMILDMFLDMYGLINEQQQHSINSIESHVSKARDYVDYGSLRTKQYLSKQKKKKKKSSFFKRVIKRTVKSLFFRNV